MISGLARAPVKWCVLADGALTLHIQLVQLILEDDLVSAARLTEDEARLAIAVSLFTEERLSLALAARLAGMDRLSFQRYLSAHEIPLHYGDDELAADLATVQWLHEGGPARQVADGQA